MEQDKQDLLKYLGLNDNTSTRGLNSLVQGESRFVKDLHHNLNTILEDNSFTERETFLIALVCSTTLKNETLCSYFNHKARVSGATDPEIGEVVACASILTANNILYRFKHTGAREDYSKMQSGMRMAITARPVLGKELFELMSLAVSAINNCESCVRFHEDIVMDNGGTKERIWDAIRIASVLASTDKLIGI